MLINRATNITQENNKNDNPFNHMLIPRLFEKKSNNSNSFLGNKRISRNDSESKNYF
jgi:hypothetical protein